MLFPIYPKVIKKQEKERLKENIALFISLDMKQAVQVRQFSHIGSFLLIQWLDFGKTACGFKKIKMKLFFVLKLPFTLKINATKFFY